MNIAKQTTLPPIEVGYIVDPARPVITLAMEVNRTGCAAAHRHPRGQLIYAGCGVMRVLCGRDAWVVPPTQAVWMPPEVEHEVYFPGHAILRNLFLDPSVCAGLPVRCTVLRIAPLLRELILKAVTFTPEEAAKGSGLRLMRVIIDELRQAEPTPLHLPMGRDPRLMKVIEALLADPADPRELAAWSRTAGAGTRTLARLFVRETGMSFGAWRQQLRLLEAVERLGHGETVTDVAFGLGYRSLSAFVAMFGKALGAPPGQYLRRDQESEG